MTVPTPTSTERPNSSNAPRAIAPRTFDRSAHERSCHNTRKAIPRTQAIQIASFGAPNTAWHAGQVPGTVAAPAQDPGRSSRARRKPPCPGSRLRRRPASRAGGHGRPAGPARGRPAGASRRRGWPATGVAAAARARCRGPRRQPAAKSHLAMPREDTPELPDHRCMASRGTRWQDVECEHHRGDREVPPCGRPGAPSRFRRASQSAAAKTEVKSDADEQDEEALPCRRRGGRRRDLRRQVRRDAEENRYAAERRGLDPQAHRGRLRGAGQPGRSSVGEARRGRGRRGRDEVGRLEARRCEDRRPVGRRCRGRHGLRSGDGLQEDEATVRRHLQPSLARRLRTVGRPRSPGGLPQAPDSRCSRDTRTGRSGARPAERRLDRSRRRLVAAVGASSPRSLP